MSGQVPKVALDLVALSCFSLILNNLSLASNTLSLSSDVYDWDSTTFIRDKCSCDKTVLKDNILISSLN